MAPGIPDPGKKGMETQKLDPTGFEPVTSAVPRRRAPNCATGPRFPTSGADRIRTGDLSRARGALSQLSYGPTGTLHFTRRT